MDLQPVIKEAAVGKLSNEELEAVYNTGIKPSEYLANK